MSRIEKSYRFLIFSMLTSAVVVTAALITGAVVLL